MNLKDIKICYVNQKISITEDIIEKINKFSDEIDTNHYNNRNQTNVKKKRKDQFAGKLAEWSVYLYLKDNGINISEPDMQIYKRGSKSFKPDMTVENISLHCKSCHANSRYPVSWIFQKSDRNGISGKDKEFYNKSNNGLIFCCESNQKDNSVLIHWIIDKNIAIDLLEPPIVLQLKNIKECLYDKTIKKIYEENEN